MRQPACFVVGLLTSPFVIAPAARVDTMAVRFRPGGAYPFFRGPLTALTDRAAALDDLWGREAADRIWQRLAETSLARRSGDATKADHEAARVGVISRELLQRLAMVEPDRATASAVADFVGTSGRASIGRVAARAGMTTRHLQRQFAERVGVSPKLLARILRFQRTLLQRAAPDRPRPDWVRVAVDCGYTDQSHLIRDYPRLPARRRPPCWRLKASSRPTSPHRSGSRHCLPRGDRDSRPQTRARRLPLQSARRHLCLPGADRRCASDDWRGRG